MIAMSIMMLTTTRSACLGVLRRAAADRRGVSSLVFAVAASSVIGMAGLATQAGLWYADYANMQSAADAASTAGAVAIAASETTTQSTASATYVLSQDGFVNNQNGVTATVNVPPKSGSYKNNTNAVEVLLTKTANLTVAGLFLASAPTLKVRSVALYGGTASTCVLALGQNIGGANDGQFTLSGGAMLNATGCVVGSNSTAAKAFYVLPSPTVDAYTILSSGGVTSSCGQGPTGCGSVLSLTKPYAQDHVASADPLASVQKVPLPDASYFTASSCSTLSFPQWNSANTLVAGTTYCGANLVSANTLTFPAGGGTFTFTGNVNIGASSGNPVVAVGTGTASPVTVYVNGNFDVANNARADIPPGTYFINGGNLIVGNSATLSCSTCSAGGAGVTFVVMTGNVQISGSSPVSFSAPATNNYNAGLDGVAIYQPLSNTSVDTLSGSGTLSIQGAFYAPGAELNISGGAGTSTDTCSSYVANTITMSGSGYATNSSCTKYGYGWAASGPTPNGVTIVE